MNSITQRMKYKQSIVNFLNFIMHASSEKVNASTLRSNGFYSYNCS